jgi:hypothetical protein
MIGAIFMKFGRAPTTHRIGAVLLLLDTDYTLPNRHERMALALEQRRLPTTVKPLRLKIIVLRPGSGL